MGHLISMGRKMMGTLLFIQEKDQLLLVINTVAALSALLFGRDSQRSSKYMDFLFAAIRRVTRI